MRKRLFIRLDILQKTIARQCATAAAVNTTAAVGFRRDTLGGRAPGISWGDAIGGKSVVMAVFLGFLAQD
jgi:hypothetical protein